VCNSREETRGKRSEHWETTVERSAMGCVIGESDEDVLGEGSEDGFWRFTSITS
jgi:hypothetical protein